VDQPASASVTVGQPATFTVEATGSGALAYQWYKDGVNIPGGTGASYSISQAKASDSGSYTVDVSDSAGGSQLSQGALLAVAPSSGGPTISTQPMGGVVAVGSSIALDALSGQAGVSYQWYLNGVPITMSQPSASGEPGPRAGAHTVSGEASSTLLITGATSGDSGTYECIASIASGSVLSSPAAIDVITTSDPGRLINLSCRSGVGTGANILIAGFVVGGGASGSEPVLVRGSGPALTAFSVTGVLPDPVLNIYGPSGSSVASNSGWAGSAAISTAAASVHAFTWTDTSSHDSAVSQSLPVGAYTAQVSGASGDTGIALAEVYDATANFTASSPRLINVSARVQVGTGANILIAGFVVGGSTSKTVLVRASGPALSQFQVTGVLPDPQLQIFDSSGKVVASNAGWAANGQISYVSDSVHAFSWGTSPTPDSALVVTLPPGAYTAQVSGAAGDTGVALAEVYDVP
jgi:hypothetical protein